MLAQNDPAISNITKQLIVMPLETEQQSAYCTHPELLIFP